MIPCRFDDDSRHVSLNVPVKVPLNVPFQRPESGEDEPPAGGEPAAGEPAAGVVGLVVVVVVEFELQAAATRTITTKEPPRRGNRLDRRSPGRRPFRIIMLVPPCPIGVS